MLNVQILLFEGVDELDAIAPFEVFQCAAGLGWQMEITCATLDLTPEVTTAHLPGRPRPCPILGQGWLPADRPATDQPFPRLNPCPHPANP